MEEIKETLEEAANKYAESYRCPATNDNEYCRHDIISAINFGAKWKQEQDKKLYSEEEVLNLLPKFAAYTLINADEDTRLSLDKWFEQFKK